MKTTTSFAFLSLAFCYASSAQADTFGSGFNTFDLNFVTIRNAGNADDTTGDPNPAGEVDYTYRMGQFEISEDMINKANAQSLADGDPLGITKDTRGADKPATNVSWLEAAQFVNWLNTNAGGTPAYKFDGSGNLQLWLPGDAGYNPNNFYRNSLATYFLPSVDEWYKAAYYNPTGVYYNYPTASDTPPTAVVSGTSADTAVYDQAFATGPADITQAGGLSPYGTMGQGGNAYEWEETDYDLVNDSISSARGVRGGSWDNSASLDLSSSSRYDNGFPTYETYNLGFRIASIPLLTWNQLGPGTFGYETAANWTPSEIPTADNDVVFLLDGDVDVVPFSTSVANNVTFSDGVVRLKSLGATTFTSYGGVTVDDLLATNLTDGAFATLEGTTGTSWTTSLDLQVGNEGFGTFIVNNGADFDAQQILIGNQTGAEGEVTVTGIGSMVAATLNADTSLYRIGFAGGTGIMSVLDGATITTGGLVGDVSVGEGLGSTGTLNVGGPGSNALMDDLLVGFGGVGFLNITGGGLVDQAIGVDPDAQVAVSDLSANLGAGTVVVNGDDSRWNFRQGEFGSDGLGSVAVEAGGRIAATEGVTVGLNSTSQGSLHVTGVGTVADSLVSVGGDLIVGQDGQGTLTVDLGGDVTVGNDMFIGMENGNLNDNVVTITNTGSSLTIADRLEVGRGGNGTLDITDNGIASALVLNVAELAGGNGTMTVSGSSSSFTVIDALVGTRGTGALTITGGAYFESRRFWVGFNGVSEGTVDVSGAGSTLAITGGSDLVSLRIGGNPNDDGGTATVTVSEGGKIISNNNIYIGGNLSSVGSLTVTGPTSLADFNDGGMDAVTVVGYAGEGALSILNGGRVESETAMIGQLAGATGTANVGDGNTQANWNVGGSLYVGGSDTEAGGTGLMNINSQGTVTVADELKIWDDGAVFLNSATSTLSVGTLSRAAGGQFNFLRGNLVLTSSGLDINAAGPLGDSVSIVPGQTLSTTGGGLVNDGDLNVIGTAVSFTGGPSVNNADAEVNAINTTLTFDGDLTNYGDVNLINTTVNGSLINGGTGALAMIGVNSFSDDLQFGAQDNLYVDISGPNPGEFDALSVGGEAELAGSLNVSFVSGFSPSAGDTFDILTAAGGIGGTFTTENLPTLVGDLQWFVNYSATSLSLVSTLAADFSEDGYVDGDDLADWKAGLGSPDATHMQGDADGDGDSDGTDFLIWQRQLGSVVTIASTNTAVPEPTALLLSLLGLSAVGIRRRRFGN